MNIIKYLYMNIIKYMMKNQKIKTKILKLVGNGLKAFYNFKSVLMPNFMPSFFGRNILAMKSAFL